MGYNHRDMLTGRLAKGRSGLEHHRPGDFFVLRFPLQPFADLIELGNDDRIRELSEDPQFREALFFASPAVDEQAQRWSELKPARAQQLGNTIYKYLSRMTTRCAPFGAFAGYCTGRTGAMTDFRAADAPNKRVVELSSSWLRQILESNSPNVRERSRWDRNPTMRIAAEVVRYVERHTVGGAYSYALSEVEHSALVDAALKAADGATVDAITAAVLAADEELTEDEARKFVNDLIDVQLLVSDFELPLSSIDPAADAVRLLRERGLEDAAALIEQAAAALQAISKESLGVDPAAYQRIAGALDPELDANRIFNAKLTRGGTPQLGAEVLGEIDRAVALLHRAGRSDASALQSFAAAFEERYGTREVPLLEALDPETGIPFPPITPDSSPLIDGLPFQSAAERRGEWLDRDAVLLDFVLRGGSEIELTGDDRTRLGRAEPLPLPDTFVVQASIAARSEDDLRSGDFRVVVEGMAGPSAARMLTRFCSTDAVLHEHVRQHIADEERCRPDAIFAEVLHLPEGAHAVMAGRPPVREYEIPLLAASALPREQQLALDDLLLSVVHGHIQLRSRRHGREVIPRMTTALNIEHERGIALFRFFGALTRQGRACTLYWDWGSLAAAAHLPRVSAGRVVLSRELWRVFPKELDAIDGDDARMMAWSRERGLPRFVRIRGELTVDLSTRLGRAVLADEARRGAVLTELFPDADNLWLNGTVHEILVPYVSTREPASAPPPRAQSEAGQRVFVPGSEWLFAKIYTGPSSADRLLIGPIAKLVEELRRDGVIDRWFFLRYHDPDSHLRVRFHGDVALPRLRAALQTHLDAGVVARLELATYDREVERYGGWAGIELAEELFCVDSDAVIALLSELDGDDDGRWKCAVAGADRLLDDFGCPLETKRSIVQNLRMTQAGRFAVDKPLVRQLGDRYRRLRAEVEAAMQDRARFDERSRRFAPVIEELRRRELTAPLSAIARSLVHMFLNRLFRGAHAQHEYVVCDFLDRAYESAAMRARKKS